MSLGIKSLWRAHLYTPRVKELSLISRESRHLLPFGQPYTRRWLSVTKVPAGGPSRPPLEKFALIKGDEAAVMDGRLVTSTSPSSLRRTMLRRVIRQRSELGPIESAIIKQPVRYPSRRASIQSQRKHRRSATRQHLHDQAHEANSRPPNDWQTTLQFMLRHTPKSGEILDFKVVIGRGAAAKAREALWGLDTNVWQIQQKNHCVIRLEEADLHDGSLIFSLSGPELSVRTSLLDIVRAVGKLTAVRVLDQKLRLSLSDILKGSGDSQGPVNLLGDGDGEDAVDDMTMTVHKDSVERPVRLVQPSRYRPYELTRRADDITPPAQWTKRSFEKYVAALVYGQLPTHLAQPLYPTAPDHQTTVVSLLVDVFTSEHSRSSMSVSALKIASRFIQARGPAFRSAARDIFQQAELLKLPLDAEVFAIFLVGASRFGDLDGFNSVLRLMVRRHFSPQGHAWLAFLGMIHDPEIKHHVMQMMRAKGLGRFPSIRSAMARQESVVDLEHSIPADFDVRRYIQQQDEKYGPLWLDTVTLNKMIHAFGSHGKLGVSNALLDFVYESGRVRLDACTLNTMITHSMPIPQKIAAVHTILSRWPRLEPDSVTYHQLFRVAWHQRLPNMLRVIWRYAVLAKSTTSKMRYALTTLLRQERDLSAKRALLKAWEDVIFGRAELAALRLSDPDRISATQMMSRYLDEAGTMMPSVDLAIKLNEAYFMDKRIHRHIKDGTVMTSSMRESLSVDIPLAVKRVASSSKTVRRVASLSHNVRRIDSSSKTVRLLPGGPWAPTDARDDNGPPSLDEPPADRDFPLVFIDALQEK
ncbi:Uu.00g106740.m01.CDS01 [Anthostomella pinea]|uniref:Uu.00g106740.m01.CDS01 n=1 Tax=Anthostomella pinea TaxID=933095 RepID=A0AAI8VE99_9PEZI|nr:Uu.00g106740.m01.CDS01 [Anthostomella pinea]